jgi:DNA-binding NarL/FixJ family response regulator
LPAFLRLVDASDGHDAVLIARRLRCHIAILDFNMPRLDGVEAALLLRRDCPSTRVAVHSSDPDRLKERAAGLGLAVFDKLEFELLLAWVGRQARQGLGLRPWRRSHRGVATSVPFVAMASLAASP